MTANEKAIELIEDCLQIQLPTKYFEDSYEMAKIQALYSANVAKWSHNELSAEHNYWQEVKEEIEKL